MKCPCPAALPVSSCIFQYAISDVNSILVNELKDDLQQRLLSGGQVKGAYYF